MQKVMLFGSSDIYEIPEMIENHMREIVNALNGDVKFLVGDGKSIDSGFHKALSAIGARDKSVIYSIDNVRNNKFELPVRLFKSSYDLEKSELQIADETGEVIFKDEKVGDIDKATTNPAYRSFTMRKMIDDCDFAICYKLDNPKYLKTYIMSLNARNKYIYMYNIFSGTTMPN